MKRVITLLILLTSYFSFSQMTANSYIGAGCSWMSGCTYNVTWNDVNNNPPYTIELWYVNSIPPNYFYTSITSADSSGFMSFYDFGCFPEIEFIIFSATGDTIISSALLNNYNPLHATTINETCSIGELSIYAGGGVPPYTYSLDGWNWQASNTFTGLACDPNLDAYVQDANGCQTVGQYYVASGGNSDSTCTKLITVSVIDETVFDSCDGSLSWTISGLDTNYLHELFIDGPGSADTTIIISGSDTTGTWSNLCDGQYKLLVDQDSSCNKILITSVTGPPEIILTHESDLAPIISCQDCNSKLKWSFDDNHSKEPYEISVYKTDGSAVLVDQFSINYTAAWGYVDSLCPGNYEMYISDINGDSSYATTMIDTVINDLSLISISENLPTTGNSNGSIEVSTTGGTPPINFYINDTLNTNAVFDSLPAGTYLIKCVDSNGCESEITVTLENSDVGINSDIAQDLKVYPNPVTSDQLNIQLAGFHEISLMDLNSREIYATSFTDNTILSVETVQNGVYILFIDHRIQYRLVINK